MGPEGTRKGTRGGPFLKNHSVITIDPRDRHLREAFFQFTGAVFPGADFIEWYRHGGWIARYRPYAVVEAGQVVANASVAELEVIVNGKTRSAVQLGAVGTVPSARGRGLSRRLLQHILDLYRDKVDLIFLFANESVLDFYPRFGFQRAPEHRFVARARSLKPRPGARRVQLDDPEEGAIIRRLLEERRAVTGRFGAVNYAFVTLWHLVNLDSYSLYYVEAADALLLVRVAEKALHVRDVVFSREVDLGDLLAGVVPDESPRDLWVDFPPDQLAFDFDQLEPVEELMVLGEFEPGEEPFRFPPTAVT